MNSVRSFLFHVLKPGFSLMALVCTNLALAQNIVIHEPELISTVESRPINEMSGIVKSKRRDDLYWVHNDSGDEPRIFAINSDGKNVLPTYSRFTRYGEQAEQGKEQWQGFKVLFAENVDWEDMTIDDNYLYIADTGNNGNKRRDLGIYLISEIDPTASTQSAAIKHLPVSYPEQQSFPAANWHFDSESLFASAGKLYLITKHRVAGSIANWQAGANLYRLDTSYADRDNLLTLIGSHPEITAASGAELSPDGSLLAVISYTDLWLFNKPESGDNWLAGASSRLELDPDTMRQVEAITWEADNTLLVTNEQRDIFRVRLDIP